MRRAGLLLAFAIFLAGCASAESSLPTQPFALLDGGTIELGEVDQPRVINLWATWCAPCREELPVFDDVAPRALKRGVEIVGLNVGDSSDAAAELIAELDLSFPQALDPEAAVQTGLRITGMPSTIFLDEAGAVVTIHSGEVDEAELVELITETYRLDPPLR